jgi:hypothetical protein
MAVNKQSSSGSGERGTRENRRPVDVDSLLYQGNTHPTFALANRQKKRFFITNLARVLSQIPLAHSGNLAPHFFDEAKRVITSETAWSLQLAFKYECSHIQIFPGRLTEPKFFGNAATLIVALELAAAALVPGLNVYDMLRILPADFFVDGFDTARLDALIAYHAKLTASERTRLFGPEFANMDFLETCCTKIEQLGRTGLPGEMADGYCVTRQVAERLSGFINGNYPPHLRVGLVRASGDHGTVARLGHKAAASQLVVACDVDQQTLPLCR